MQNYTLTVTAAQRELGAISDFELMRAKAQVQDTASRLPTLRKSIDAAINRLSILTETSPQVLQPMLSQTKTIPNLATSVVVAMPLTVIEQRPDVHAAERRLAQAAALRNAAFAGYFPDRGVGGRFD